MRDRSAVALGGGLALVGGALILFSGIQVQSLMLYAVNYVYLKEGNVIPGSIEPLVRGFILVLGVIIFLGGSLAIAGGLLIFSRHLTVGKILVALGGGIGFAGIVFSIGYDVYAYGFTVIISRLDYWIGILLATLGRYVVKDAH